MSQIGKVCHTKCAIYYQAGDCVMPREGIFAVVREAGDVATGDAIEVVSLGDGTCDRTPPEAVAEFEAEKAREAAEVAAQAETAAAKAEASSGSGQACAPASARTRAKGD
jgi:hypothetical protein